MKVLLIFLSVFFVTVTFAIESKSMEFEDKVRKILPDKDADKVMFQLHAAIYVLKKGKNYESIKKALVESQEKKKEVHLIVNPESLEIEELAVNKKSP